MIEFVELIGIGQIPQSAPTTELNTQLLAAVCAEYVTGEELEWRKAIAEHPDPGTLILLAEQHGVLPLFARAVSLAGIHCEMAQMRARVIAFRNLALASELVKLTHALEEVGIKPLAYKGPLLAQQLYGDVTLRQFLDLDILVAPADVFLARDVLSQCGYFETEPLNRSLLRKHLRTQCEWQMVGADSGIAVELHWALFPRYASFDLCFSELKQTSVDVEIAGQRLKTLDPLHLALALAAHGTKHFWGRLGWLVDFALGLRGCDNRGAEKLLEAAARKGVKRTLLISADLAHQVLEVGLPQNFVSAISADSRAQSLAGSMHQMLWTGAVPLDLLSQNIFLLRSRERWFDRAKIVLRLAFTPGPEEWRWMELPQWAECFYRPIRMVRAARYLPSIAQRMLPLRTRRVG